MKKIFFLLCIAFSAADICAQDDETFSASKLRDIESNMALVWTDGDPDFKSTTIPAQWNDQSGVIISQKTKFAFDKDANKLAVYEITRRRIKLNDRDAVNNYSSVFFRIGSSRDGAGIKVIKSNGTVRDVSLRNAIYVEDASEVPSTFQPYIGKANTKYDKSKSAVIYYKIAVPDLDPGDIIDYGTIFYDDNTVKKMSYIEFDPIYFICTREYPVVSQKFEIDTDDNSFVNSKSINGAPEFKETGNSSSDYAWEDRNRERLNDSRWVNNYVDLPVLKFQIIFSRKENRSDLFIGDRGELKKSFSPDELAKKIASIYSKMEVGELQATTQYYLKQIGFKDLREDDYINKLYYILRHINYHRYGGEMPSEYFAYTFMWGLELKKIPSELVVTSASFVTKPSDIIFKRETEWIVKVKDKFVFAPTIFSNPFDYKDDFQNVQAYIITLGKSPAAKPVTLPILKADENLTVNTITASLDTGFTVINVTRQEAFRGRNKVPANVDGLIYTTALDDDYKSYGGEDDIRAQLKGPILESYEDKLRERKKEDKQRKIDYMKNSLLEDYDHVLAYHDFTLNSDGRSLRKPDLVYTSRFDLGDMVRKAGKNLLVSVPGLIGDQLFITQKERKREYDANMGYARTFINEITFNIPAGYSVVGLPSLNTSVDNEVGSFSTIAKVEGNLLKISVKKVYKQMVVKKDDWKKMLVFLDAAFNFSQKKVLLKKQ